MTRKIVDTRLTGSIAERILLSILNQRGIFAHQFDTAGFDGIAFDIRREIFRTGRSPFFIQIKCRGSASEKPNTQGHNPNLFKRIQTLSQQLEIPEDSLYFAAGFYTHGDIRRLIYYVLPFSSLHHFRSSEQYRFSVERCEQVMEVDPNITKL